MTALLSETSTAGSVTGCPSTLTRPAAIRRSDARRDATPELARYLTRRIKRSRYRCARGPRPARTQPERVGRAALPRTADLGMDRARRRLRRDDKRPGGAEGASRARGAAVHPERGARAAGARRHREGTLSHRRRPAARGGPDALRGRAPLAVPVEPVRLSAHLHVLPDRHDALRAQPDGERDPRPDAPLPPSRTARPRRLHGHGRAADEP